MLTRAQVRRLAQLERRLRENNVCTLQSDSPEEFERMLEMAGRAGFDTMHSPTLISTRTKRGARVIHVVHVVRAAIASPTLPTQVDPTPPPSFPPMTAEDQGRMYA